MVNGSLVNHLMGNSKQAEPKVGDGATELCWSDRAPYTIVAVLGAKRIVVQADNAKRTDKNGMSESQAYEFSPNPDAEKVIVTLRKNGKWIRVGSSQKGQPFLIGHRDSYHDYSF